MFAKDRELSIHTLKKEVANFAGKPFNECSAEDVTDFFYGAYDSGRDSRDCDFSIVHKYGYGHRKKWYNRLAYLVVLPVVLLIIPFMWVIYGETGVSNRTKIGRFLAWLVGEYTFRSDEE